MLSWKEGRLFGLSNVDGGMKNEFFDHKCVW